MTIKHSQKEAFTLMEILIVVIIMGLIASLAFSNLGAVIESHRAKEGEQILYAIYGRYKAAAVEKDMACPSISQLGVTIPSPENFEPPFSDACWIDIDPAVIHWPLSISRKGGLYMLDLDVLTLQSNIPRVTCSSSTAGLCQQLGY
ncbi:MAG: type II secretion system protein [Candidatus Omnitrophica bacterium]|nr:type II secretion system protein [Candidatus Omnitrophota bacterium]